jgi:hypothetical protein
VLRAFLDADAVMRESPHPRVELEIATVRATRRPQPRALEEVLKRVEEAEARLRQQGVAAPGPGRAQESLLAGLDAPTRPAPEPRRSPVPIERSLPSPPSTSGASASGSAARSEPSAPATAAAPPASGDMATGWQRVIEDVMRRKPTLGAVLSQSRPAGVRERELVVVLTGNHFHREMLADSANRDLVAQALRRHVAGAERFGVAEDEGGGGGGATEHPAVQAAVAEFQGEVVAVRPRLPEGGSQ